MGQTQYWQEWGLNAKGIKYKNFGLFMGRDNLRTKESGIELSHKLQTKQHQFPKTQDKLNPDINSAMNWTKHTYFLNSFLFHLLLPSSEGFVSFYSFKEILAFSKLHCSGFGVF